MDGEDANDIMLDSAGPTVNKPPSEFNGSTGKVRLLFCFSLLREFALC